MSESRSVTSDSLQPHGLYSPWNSPGQNTRVGSHSLLQGIFPTQGSDPGLPHCRQILYQLSHKGSNTSWLQEMSPSFTLSSKLFRLKDIFVYHVALISSHWRTASVNRVNTSCILTGSLSALLPCPCLSQPPGTLSGSLQERVDCHIQILSVVGVPQDSHPWYQPIFTCLKFANNWAGCPSIPLAPCSHVVRLFFLLTLSRGIIEAVVFFPPRKVHLILDINLSRFLLVFSSLVGCVHEC